MLFIAPVHGKKNPQLAYPIVTSEEDNAVHNVKLLKKNVEYPNNGQQIEKARLENVVKRPIRPSSKVFLA